MKRLGELCFVIPFVFSALNIQTFISMFFSVAIGQAIAYINFGLVILGLFVFLKKDNIYFPAIIKLWIWFFSFYLSLGLLANAIYDTPVSLLKSTIPFVYFLGFAVFLSNSKQHERIAKLITAVFLISCILLILLQRLNFSLDHEGVYKYSLERADGVYGDANNASIVCLLSFIFIQHIIRPKTIFQRILKILASIISLYALILTFSKTGFIVLLIVLGLTYRRIFNPKRILLSIVLLPITLYAIINIVRDSTSLSVIQKNRIEDIINLLSFNTNKVEYSNRDELFENLMKFIVEHPFIGNGIDFSVNIRGHNTIFGIWADAGIFSFILFLILIFQIFKRSLLAPINIRYFSVSIFMVLIIFMMSLQTVINQPYLIVIFVWLSFLISQKEITLDSKNFENNVS
jgi:O-antigen ligase